VAYVAIVFWLLLVDVMSDSPLSDLERYSRQMRFAPIGEEGQRRLADARVLVCGLGALGSVSAATLVRAGVGFVRVVDRDFLELSNLQRQSLYDEADVASGLPKAIAAERKLRAINSQVTIEAFVADVNHKNIATLASDVDVIVDGSDNFEVRFLVNDFAMATGTPWVYGGAIGAEGQTLTIVPGDTPCLACLIPEPPPAGASPTCDTAGILAPAIQVVAALQATEALKLLSGNTGAISREWTIVDLWNNRLRQIKVDGLRAAGNCRCCTSRDFVWLDGRRGSQTAILCGRNAVQLRPAERTSIDLAALGRQLATSGQVMQNDHLLRLEVDLYSLTLFPDGRAIVAGTDDEGVARSLLARYVGF
jgi:molybdopterin/thiamine biosynthesis adenylyltransferase